MEIEVVAGIDAELADRLAALWVAVTDAGGAVGFVYPYERSDVDARVDDFARAVAAGTSHVLVVRTDPSGPVHGWIHIERNAAPIVAHWAWLKQLMVEPDGQGTGVGSAILGAAEALAFGDLGLESVYLTCRSGTGLRAWYEGRGYTVAGRMPGNLRLADGERRDEVYLFKHRPEG